MIIYFNANITSVLEVSIQENKLGKSCSYTIC